MHCYRRIACIAVCLLFIGVGIALADDGQPSALAPMWDEVVKALGQGLALAAAAILTWLLAQLKARVGIQVSDAQHQYLLSLAQAGVARAEEWGAAQVKANLEAKSSEKMEKAIEYILKRAPGIDEDEATQLAEAALPLLGRGGAAVTRAMRTSSSATAPAA